MADILALHGSHAFWAWTALAAALLGVEVITGSGWLLWPAACAAITAVLAPSLGLSPAEAVAVFAVLTVITTVIARRLMPRRGHDTHDINDNVARLVGREARAVAAFQDGAGRVFIDGKEWAAELSDGETIAAGGAVRVVKVEGARLKVRPA